MPVFLLLSEHTPSLTLFQADQSSYISIVSNDGTSAYTLDPSKHELGGCIAPVRNSPFDTYINVVYRMRVLTVC